MWQWLKSLFGFGGAPAPSPAPSAPAPAAAVAPAPAEAAPAPVTGIHLPSPDAGVRAPWLDGVVVPVAEPTAVLRQLRKLLTDLAAEAPTEADRLWVERLIRLVEAGQLDLPPFPDVARELDDLLKQATTDILQIARVVERDPGLVRRVWSQARSAAYAQPPRSLHHAVARVGLDALWRIGMSVCMNDTVFRIDGYQHEADDVRTHGILTAEVAAALGGEKRGGLYMAGLLHDVGELVLLRTAGECRPAPAVDWVHAVAARCRTPLSVLVAGAWGLDDAVCGGIGFRADPGSAPPRHERTARTVQAATIAAHATLLARAGRGVTGADAEADIRALGFDPLSALDRAREVADSLQAGAAPA